MTDREVIAKYGAKVRSGEISSSFYLARESGITRHAARRIVRLIEEGAGEETAVFADGRTWSANYEYNPATERYLTYVKAAPRGLIVTSRATHEAMISAYSNWGGKPATINEMCARFGMPRRHLVEYMHRHDITHDHEPFSREEVMGRSVEDLAEENYQRKRQALHQASEHLKWKRISEDAENWAAFEDTTLARLVKAAGKRRAAKVTQIPMDDADRPFALFLSWQDLHLGMYSRDGYDMQEAKRRLMATVGDIIERLPGRPEIIHLTIGGDVTHTDGVNAATTKGTPLDTDGNPGEHLEAACDLQVLAIDTLRQIAPVVGHPVPGNHGRANDLALQLYLYAWYRGTKDVQIKRSHASRSYLVYGSTLIGMCHGDGVRPQDLGSIMASEAREDWGRTEHHVWFTGHLHHYIAQEIGGITHYLLPSLAGTDRWHHQHGYVTSEPALMAYMVDKEGGVMAWLRSAVRHG